MKSIALKISGKPIAKARPRFFVRKMKDGTNYIGTYKDKDQAFEEQLFITKARNQMNGLKLLAGPLSLHVRFYLPRPKSHYGTGRNVGLLKIASPIYPDKRPDLDNLVKFVKDCLNEVAYHDDSQIVDTIAFKRYTNDEGLTVIKLQVMDGY